MSDPLDLVRTANPVPAPTPFDGEVRRRIVAAIIATEPPTARKRPLARALRGVRRARMLVVVGGVLVIAAGTAAALGILNGTPSNPPAGAFSTPKSDERGAASGYAARASSTFN